jgi:hypothetical protein
MQEGVPEASGAPFLHEKAAVTSERLSNEDSRFLFPDIVQPVFRFFQSTGDNPSCPLFQRCLLLFAEDTFNDPSKQAHQHRCHQNRPE